MLNILVFTLQSIKSRIETTATNTIQPQLHRVFTLQSIKSRIETARAYQNEIASAMFLLYSPLNQGLKPHSAVLIIRYSLCFYSTVH